MICSQAAKSEDFRTLSQDLQTSQRDQRISSIGEDLVEISKLILQIGNKSFHFLQKYIESLITGPRDPIRADRPLHRTPEFEKINGVFIIREQIKG